MAFSETASSGVGGTGTCDGTSFTLAEGLAAEAKPSTTHWLSLIQNRPAKRAMDICAAQVNVYDAAMQTTLRTP